MKLFGVGDREHKDVQGTTSYSSIELEMYHDIQASLAGVSEPRSALRGQSCASGPKYQEPPVTASRDLSSDLHMTKVLADTIISMELLNPNR